MGSSAYEDVLVLLDLGILAPLEALTLALRRVVDQTIREQACAAEVVSALMDSRPWEDIPPAWH